MEDKRLYYTSTDIQNLLGVSRSVSYKLMKELNEELKEKGYIVIAGKIPRAYFAERYYGLAQ